VVSRMACARGSCSGLGHQIGGHLLGLGAVVGDHQEPRLDLQGVDANQAIDASCQGHVEVAGAG